MKKLLVAVLTLAIAVTSFSMFTACKKEEKVIALITLHDENSSYDANFINGFKAACEAKGLTRNQYAFVTGVDEDLDKVYTEASNFASQGYKAVFADSFGHEAGMIKAAKEYTSVQFCHATGTQACMEKLSNFHNAFASIYEGRYLAGIAAGMWLNANSPSNHKVGYVGAFPYAEVISGMTSFFLGVKSVCTDATMVAKFTNSWYDPVREQTTAAYLINDQGCALISGHADSDGVPNACETASKGNTKIPNVFYNGTHNKSVYLAACKINWQVYFELLIDSVQNGTEIAQDWVGTLKNGAVQVLKLGDIAAAGTQDAINAAADQLKAGTLNVFDCSKFTVNAAKADTSTFSKASYITMDQDGHLTAYSADCKDDGSYTGDTNVVADGIFQESKFRSAPYFDITIDGITNLGSDYNG